MMNLKEKAELKSYLVDVPVVVFVWCRPQFSQKQFEVMRKARPSVLFLASDGGRNPEEMDNILKSRAVFEQIDWECEVHKLYMDENQGMYKFGRMTRLFVFERVEQCIYLEDDQIPALSFFRYCAELLERYKDDQRIQMISGYNALGVYEDALPNDYFFTEQGWLVWGFACWKRSYEDFDYPLPYANDKYIKKCLKRCVLPEQYRRVEGYSRSELADRHPAGAEYYFMVNNVLQHKLTIVPTKNMITNMGAEGTHAQRKIMLPRIRKLLNSKAYEISEKMVHPRYVIDDKNYVEKFRKMCMWGNKHILIRWFSKVYAATVLLFTGGLLKKIKQKMTIER